MTTQEEAKHKSGEVLEFWRERASLGTVAGTRDIIAKQLEIEAISRYVRDGMRILEAGCGNGITAIELARRFAVSITGFDYAPEMIEQANLFRIGQELRGTVHFEHRDVNNVAPSTDRFDLVYTERVLINLDSWEKQHEAIAALTGLLAPGGRYIMCENSADGLESINGLRRKVKLPPVIPPWHNRYLRDTELASVRLPGIELESVDYYSSTYYLFSRVVNAWIAAQENHEPDYDAPLNQLALALPSIGTLGQGRIWVWRRQA